MGRVHPVSNRAMWNNAEQSSIDVEVHSTLQMTRVGCVVEKAFVPFAFISQDNEHISCDIF